jgi:hypothetical protein
VESNPGTGEQGMPGIVPSGRCFHARFKHLARAAFGRPWRFRDGGTVITKTDFIGIPSTDAERSRRVYVETLGLRAD